MSTASAKSSTIMDLFDIYQMDPEWTLKSKMDANLLIWMVMVDGMIVDVRDQPREFQEMVFDMGLIPYIPGEK